MNILMKLIHGFKYRSVIVGVTKGSQTLYETISIATHSLKQRRELTVFNLFVEVQKKPCHRQPTQLPLRRNGRVKL